MFRGNSLTVYILHCGVFLVCVTQFLYCNETNCKLAIKELQGMSQSGDVIVGSVTPIHVDKLYPTNKFTVKPAPAICKTFRFENYQRVQAMRFAVEEINRNPDLLPNITLGFQIYDSCAVLQRAISGTLQILTGHQELVPNYRCHQTIPLAAVIGHSISTYTMLIAHILGLYRYPQVSHFSTVSLLSDRTQFPSFFRTVPSDAFQSQGLARLMLHFGWTWVGLIGTDNDYGQLGIQVIKRELEESGACVAFTEYIAVSQPNRNAPKLVRAIKKSTAKAVLFFSTDLDLLFILEELLRQNVTDKIWVASEAWATSSFLSVERFSKLLSGTVGFALRSGSITGFKDFLNSVHPSMSLGNDYIKIFWEADFGCKFQEQNNTIYDSVNPVKICTGSEDLRSIQNSYNDVSSLRVTYNMYIAVHMVAKALQDMNRCHMGNGPFFNRTCTNIWKFEPWQLLHYMKQVRLKTSSGTDLFFNENGDPPAAYDIINWRVRSERKISQVLVGSYDTGAAIGNIFTVKTSAMDWGTEDNMVPLSVCSESCPQGSSKAILPGKNVCCFQCVPCPHGEISNKTDSLSCFKCPWDMWPNNNQDTCLPKPREFLSYEDSLGVTLASTSLGSSFVPMVIFGIFIYYKTTPIVRANNYLLSCLLLVSLSFCFLSALYFIGYPQPGTCQIRQVAFGMVFTLCVSCILAKTIMVVIAFNATKPNSGLRKWTRPHVSYVIVILGIIIQGLLCTLWLFLHPPYFEENIISKPGVIVVECNEGSPTAFWCMLGYIGFLATISFVVAFLARNLPDSFNEAKLITFSMLAFISVWISFIPASLSARGKYTVALEIFAILSSTWSLVGCMFGTKCYIILIHPNMNSREHVMGNGTRRNDGQAFRTM